MTIFGICAGIFFAVAVVVAATNIYMINVVGDKIIDIEEASALGLGDNPPQCVEVLGASARGGKPSPILAKRIDTGMAVFAADAADVLLFSGDNGTNEYNEVAAMRSYALETGADYGVTDDVIILDYAGFSTYESMYRLRDVFLAKRAVVVTQEYHLYRALYVANRLGVDAYGVAAPGQDEGQLFRDIREIIARTKDFFFVIFDVQPTYLGDPVELTPFS
ncbi:MAG: YdcF family protein [Clostridiales Family XIII bacterium]|jgi:vancomycin permeability regulator SanA|nr:YdcF family protein [Clostridiales Family XIII bacterium]